jgi:hypothetical protein
MLLEAEDLARGYAFSGALVVDNPQQSQRIGRVTALLSEQLTTLDLSTSVGTAFCNPSHEIVLVVMIQPSELVSPLRKPFPSCGIFGQSVGFYRSPQQRRPNSFRLFQRMARGLLVVIPILIVLLGRLAGREYCRRRDPRG